MMNRTVRILVFAIALALVGGCAGHQLSKENIGTVTGAGLGAWAGSAIGDGSGQLVAVAVGTLAGAMLGGSIGRSMDEVDRMQVNRALETSPSYAPVSWSNPDTGYRYRVTPQPAYQTAQGPCRPYVVDAYVDGQPTQVEGTACRQPDGRWITQS